MKKILLLIASMVITNSARWYPANIQNDSSLETVLKDLQIISPILATDLSHHKNQTNIRTKLSEREQSQNKRKSEDMKIPLFNTYSSFRAKRKPISYCKPPRRPNTYQSRFLDVFEVVEFDHVPCSSSNGLEGVCIHEYDCHKSGGASMGMCADGYGTCCVVQFTCESKSAAPLGWLTNQEFPMPSTDRVSCTIILEKAWPDVRQFRLDFLRFELLPPTYGNCEQDQFIITGQDVNNVIPILCGINTGQHVYIEVGHSKGPITLSIQTVTAENRLFALKITQLLANNELSAPAACLQYFKEVQGYLESFNYRDTSEIVIGKTSSYLNNLNYVMCIDRKPDSCSITYTNNGHMQIVNYDGDGLPVIPPRQAGVEIFNCPSDWLLMSAVRLCGERLNDGSAVQDFSLDAPVTDNAAGPIMVWFRSDSFYTGRGFKLHYQQNSCLNLT